MDGLKVRRRLNYQKRSNRIYQASAALALLFAALATILVLLTRPGLLRLGGTWGDRPASALETDLPMAQGEIALPAPRAHLLPASFVDWSTQVETSDYFDAIRPSPAGYLVWTQFPISIYVEDLTAGSEPPEIFRAWRGSVLHGIEEWSAYVPLEVVASPEGADIQIWAKAPPLEFSSSDEADILRRARSAETRYTLYLGDLGDGQVGLLPHYEIFLSPGQSSPHIAATARHELGHALGIWGHSPTSSDVLYFSQVRTPPHISARDLNTLKRIYEQPTQIGWPLSVNSTQKN